MNSPRGALNLPLLLEAVRSGLAEIRAHKLRSALTLVGMTMGVFALICIFSLFRGFRVALSDIIASGGWSRVVLLFSAPAENPKGYAWLSAGRGLTYDDVLALRELPVVRAASSGMNTPSSVWRGTREYKTEAVGVDPQYLAVHPLRRLSRGRWITESEVRDMRRVCVVGRLLERELFPAGAVGEELLLSGVRVPVVGVLSNQGGSFDSDDTEYDDERACYLPSTTVARYLTGFREPPMVFVRIADGVPAGAALAEIRHLILRRHGGVPDFVEFNVAEEVLRFSEIFEAIMRNMNIVFGVIAGVSLVVGGLGIVSVLLISIRERVFEIGVRKAVGATDADLLVQLLVESVVLTAAGAALGALISLGLTAVLTVALKSVLPTGLPFSVPGMLLSCLFAALVGIFSGLYPALLASRMKPVEALSGA